MKRFITYLDDLAKRTYFGTDGTEPQRSGVLGYLIDGLEGLLGFFGLVILPDYPDGCGPDDYEKWCGPDDEEEEDDEDEEGYDEDDEDEGEVLE